MSVVITGESLAGDPKSEQASRPLGDAMRADQPCSKPEQDRFGYLSAAQMIARTIEDAPASHGLVLHIDGEWGSGKSSMLGLIQHSLAARQASPGHKKVQSISFNPWWFSDHEHLAQQFLEVFRDQLLRENKVLKAIGKQMAKYSDALSGVVTAAFASFSIPLPGIATKGIAAYFRLFDRSKQSVPELKGQISKALLNANQRFVVFIDDVDRLTPTEINQVFRVVKAVADFPNVVYVLAFDRKQVARALSAELQVEGLSYLEKIVQVPFVLPTLRQDVLRDLLIEDVRRSAPDVRFEPSSDQYEANVLAAMAGLVRRPRDLVRFTNAFAPAYAGLKGDVPAVDVAALELLRVVEPNVYSAIRDDGQRFIEGFGALPVQSSELDPRDADWNKGMPDPRRAAVVRLLDRIFPRRSRRTYSTQEVQRWESQGRVCSERGYTIYFRQQRPNDELTPGEVKQILNIGDTDTLRAEWRTLAKFQRFRNGSKATDLLAELRNVDQVSADFAHAFLATLLSDGDLVFEQSRGGEPIEWMMWSAAGKCIQALEQAAGDILLTLVAGAEATYSMVTIVRYILESAVRSSPHYDAHMSRVGDDAADRLRVAALGRIELVAKGSRLLAVPRLPFVLEAWQAWEITRPEAVGKWVQHVILDDDDLLALLRAFISSATSQDLSDTFAVDVPGFDIRRFMAVLPPGVDATGIDARLQQLESSGRRFSEDAIRTVSLFRAALRGLEHTN